MGTMIGTGRGRSRALRRRRLAGLGVLAVPLLVVTVFTVAEGVGGEAGWWGHLLQLAVLAGLAGLAWRWPRPGGLLLLAAGIVLGGWVLVQSAGEGAPNLGAVVLLGAPMAIAGALFVGADSEASGARRQS